MNRLMLAFRCFLAVLFRSRLPDDLLGLVSPPRLVRPGPDTQPSALPEPPSKPQPGADAAQTPSAQMVDPVLHRQRGAVQLLAVLQREGRLVDFLLEEIDSYADAQIGAAVRDIHRGCKKSLLEHLHIEPIRREPDEAVVKIAAGYDPSQIRLVGNVTGKPPFEGSLRHHGWRVQQFKLADVPSQYDPSVICPAEVELAG